MKHHSTWAKPGHFEDLLPKPNTRISDLSGVMIHNAGTDTPRGDTLFAFSNQIRPTAELLNKLPVLGAQFDPHQEGSDWVVRHEVSDGSAPLLLREELQSIDNWLSEHPERLFVLDLDTFDRLSPGDTSLAEVVLDELGHRMVQSTDPINRLDAQHGNTTVEALLQATKQVILSQRTQALEGFDQQVGVVFEPRFTHINNLNPLYNLGRGIPAVDALACTSTKMDCTHLEQSETLIEHLKRHNGTQLMLDQLSRSSFETPKGLESEPTISIVHTGSYCAQAIALALTSSLAVLAVLQAATEKREAQGQVSEVSKQANRLGQGFQTLGTVFPGMQALTSIAGLSSELLVLAQTLGIQRDAVVTHQAPDIEGPTTLAAAVEAPSVLASKAQPSGPELLALFNVMSQFASVAKYPISPYFQALSILNLCTASAGVGLDAWNTLKAARADPARNPLRRLLGQSLQLAIRCAGAGVAQPRFPGLFNTAALGIAATGSLAALRTGLQHSRRASSH